MGDYSRVTAAWAKIHQSHPGIHRISLPRRIGRMRRRDFARIIRRVCGLVEGSSVLEAGCGSGRDSLYFSYIGCRCVAVDINESPLAKLQSARELLRLSDSGKPLDLAVERADIFQLPYPPNSFDLVFNSGVIEHYDQPTRARLIGELSRVTKPGGFVALVFPNKGHILNGYWTLLIRLFSDFESYDIPENDLREVIAGELGSAGLETVLYDWLDCYDTISHFPGWWPLRALAYGLTLLFPRPPAALRRKLGTRVVVVGRKRNDTSTSE